MVAVVEKSPLVMRVRINENRGAFAAFTTSDCDIHTHL